MNWGKFRGHLEHCKKRQKVNRTDGRNEGGNHGLVGEEK